MSIQISASKVIKVILQFLQENGLTNTLQTLQEETGVIYNQPRNVPTSKLATELLQGEWESLLRHLSGLKLSPDFLIDLFEHIALEVAETGDYATATTLVQESMALGSLLKQRDPDRYIRLQRTIRALETGSLTKEQIFQKMDRMERRKQLYERLIEEQVPVIPSGQLLQLIGDACKYQHLQGLLPPGVEFDILRGKPIEKRDTDVSSRPICVPFQSILFEKGSYAKCGIFSKDGHSFVTGSVDGFIEVWDFLSGKLRKDLFYQLTEEFMLHETAVVSLDFSKTGELLASASTDGQVIVWKFEKGSILRRFQLPSYVSCLCFCCKDAQLLAGFSDGIIRLLGLKSGRIQKEYHGHTCYVNHIFLLQRKQSSREEETDEFMSASSDGSVRVWNMQQYPSCIQVIRGEQFGWNTSPSIQMAFPLKKTSSMWLICLLSNKLAWVEQGKETNGQHLFPDAFDANILAATDTLHYIYVLTEKGTLYILKWKPVSSQTPWQVEKVIASGMTSVLGMVCHPQRSMLALWDMNGKVQFYQSAASG